jgi:hypothetical protein
MNQSMMDLYRNIRTAVQNPKLPLQPPLASLLAADLGTRLESKSSDLGTRLESKSSDLGTRLSAVAVNRVPKSEDLDSRTVS